MEGTSFGRYQLVELLGRGGMGEVWRAYDTTKRREVALKVVLSSMASDQKFQQRFLREAYAAAGLTDPHVVPIHNFGEIDGRLYVDMRLVQGRDLEAVLADGPLDPARAVKIVEQVASALDAAHQVSLVHRDVKPSNILITRNDFAYLIDFGIARAADETRLTGTGGVVGSWAYMAPERFGDDADWRADIYALACVLHECLTGAPPFRGNSLEQQYTGHKFTPPPQPSMLRPGVPANLDGVIAKGMAKEPDQRYQTSLELATAARTAITQPAPRPAPAVVGFPARPTPSTPPPATPPTEQRPVVSRPPEHHVRPVRHGPVRSRRKVWIIGAAMTAVLVMVIGLLTARAVIGSKYYVATYNGKVAVMQGVQGSLLGFSLHEPHSYGCVKGFDLSEVPPSQTGGSYCRLLTLGDLNPSARASVQAGLPSDTLDCARKKLRELAKQLLPVCSAASPQEPSPPAYITTAPAPSQAGVDCRAAS
ncbi:MAG: hypothetical protein QOD58_4182 [Mycobacterium sp.]|nr:hypothetical protein [Mycobacterium sp.]